MNRIELASPTSIDDDFARWSAEQGSLLRARKLERVDVENVAEEIESLGRSEEHQIDSRMEVLISHLLKWQFQPARRSGSWKASIVEQRVRIARLLQRSPSLRAYAAGSIAGSFTIRLSEAVRETGLPESAFPAECPYTLHQLLDENHFPA